MYNVIIKREVRAMQLKEADFISELTRVFGENGLGAMLSKERCEKFFSLTERMLEENEKYNLTAITEPSKIILNHYADCALIASLFPKGARIIDVGCGAGFPTLPLAIVREDLSILAVDSTAKRISYVEESARILGLSGVTTRVMRAEDGAKDENMREKFDFATARAVAELRVLSELCLPFVKVGGKMIAMKGKNAEFELAGAKRAITILGGKDAKIESFELVGGDEVLTRPVVVIKKAAKTPHAYPRAYAQISKKPL
ncbi:MAG: 16S rRNA (guanine(527)-N(7))-methyltransferase RsmG [Clostridia bacterium]|nr:16S rRNA (guanine(527)-N(7))-methyltransferase RsmG [Clostridia bacterium]